MNTNQPTANSADQAAYIKELENLLIESGDLSNQNGLSNSVRALTTVLAHYVTTEYKATIRKTDDENMDLYDEVVTGVCDTIEYIARMGELHQEVSFTRNKLKEKGVSNG